MISFATVVPEVLLGFMGLGPTEMIIVGVIAVLLFGSRLPDVARSLGKSFVEFKKGVHGVEDEFHNLANESPKVSSYESEEDHIEPDAPKFEPPAKEPQPEADASTEASSVSGQPSSDDQPT